MIYATTFDSPLGEILMATTEDGICLIEFIDAASLDKTLQQLAKKSQLALTYAAHPLLHTLQKQLTDYFAGTLIDFALPLKPFGTPFQQQVWQTLQTIPYGQTISYAEQAQRMNNPSAIRAVASSNGKNPISIIIPCHRVIGSNGKLTGYAGGLWRKEWLLSHETKVLRNNNG